MVTRRFRKGSVYEALASRSGFDFAPVVSGRPYWELTSSGDLVLLPHQQTHHKVSKDKEATGSLQSLSSSHDCHQTVKGSPPPPPRDPREGQGQGSHEKFPSWPHLSSDEGSLINNNNNVKEHRTTTGSSTYKCQPSLSSSQQQSVTSSAGPVPCNTHRSRSWTEVTDYPKEKGSSYSRPKESCTISPQDLQPVHESSNTHAQSETRYYDREQEFQDGGRLSSGPRSLPWCPGGQSGSAKGYGREYDVPSPPERDVPFNHDPSHRYNEFVERLKASSLGMHMQQPQEEPQQQQQQHNIWTPPSLLEEQSQSDFRFEATPFLDRLRRDTDVTGRSWLLGQSETEGNNVRWQTNQSETGLEEGDLGSGCSWGVSTNPSEAGESLDSTGSSQETLKWHGSYGDLSNVSSCQVSSRSSLLFDSGLSTLADSNRLSPQSSSGDDVSQDGGPSGINPPPRPGPRRDSVAGSRRSSVARSSKVLPPQRQDSHNILYYPQDPQAPALPEREPRRKSEPPATSTKAAVVRPPGEPPLCPPPRRQRVSDPELRAIQKQALLSFYHRQTSINNSNSNNSKSSSVINNDGQDSTSKPTPGPRNSISQSDLNSSDSVRNSIFTPSHHGQTFYQQARLSYNSSDVQDATARTSAGTRHSESNSDLQTDSNKSSEFAHAHGLSFYHRSGTNTSESQSRAASDSLRQSSKHSACYKDLSTTESSKSNEVTQTQQNRPSEKPIRSDHQDTFNNNGRLSLSFRLPDNEESHLQSLRQDKDLSYRLTDDHNQVSPQRPSLKSHVISEDQQRPYTRQPEPQEPHRRSYEQLRQSSETTQQHRQFPQRPCNNDNVDFNDNMRAEPQSSQPFHHNNDNMRAEPQSLQPFHHNNDNMRAEPQSLEPFLHHNNDIMRAEPQSSQPFLHHNNNNMKAEPQSSQPFLHHVMKPAHARIATSKCPPEMTIHAEAVGKAPDVAQRRDNISTKTTESPWTSTECPVSSSRSAALGQQNAPAELNGQQSVTPGLHGAVQGQSSVAASLHGIAQGQQNVSNVEKKLVSPYVREEIIPWTALAELQARSSLAQEGQHGGPHQCSGRHKTCSPEAEAGVQTSQRRSPRKAQLSEVRHPDPARPAELRVITPEGVTVLGPSEPPQLPPRGSGKPSPPPVPPSRNHSLQQLNQPQQSRPPPPAAPPPPPPPGDSSKEDKEVSSLSLPASGHPSPGPSSPQTGSGCPSPDLPLPPPPQLDPMVSEMTHSDEPLPPPPPDLDAAINNAVAPHTQKPAVYPKNSYMSYVSGRKPSRRHGYEGNYRRSPNVSPPCRELDHISKRNSLNDSHSQSTSPHSTYPHSLPSNSNGHSTLPFQQSTSPTASCNTDTNCFARATTSPNQPTVMSDSNVVTVTSECEVLRTHSKGHHDHVTSKSGPNESGLFKSCLKENPSPDAPPQELKFKSKPSSSSDHHAKELSDHSVMSNDNRVNPPHGKFVESYVQATRHHLNKLNSQNFSLSSESKTCHRQKSQEVKSRDAYIVLPIDLGEPRTESETYSSAQGSCSQPKSRETSQRKEPEEVTSEVRNRKPEVEQVCKDEELESLSRSFAERCGDQALRNILVPGPDRVQLWDYMQGVFTREEILNRNKESLRAARHQQQQQSKAASSPNNNSQHDSLDNEKSNNRESSGMVKAHSELPAHSAYFTTSEPKAKLLTRISQTDLLNGQTVTSDSELGRKKEELISSISRKLNLLRAEQLAVQEEVSENEKLGREVGWKVERAAKANEVQKYRLHVEETEKILNLLMSLSGRLARAQNALRALPLDADQDERHLLEAKRDKLSSQHEEARALKESLDRRGRQVEAFLKSYLSEEEFGDYLHFLALKAELLVDARELDEKIRLGEEQLAALERRRPITNVSEPVRTDWNRNTGATSV